MILSKDQKKALDQILIWWEYGTPSPQVLTMGGYAGTGKSTLIGVLSTYLPENLTIAYAAYTGRAASVLRSKLPPKFSSLCSTIHGLIYEPRYGSTGKFLKWKKRTGIGADLIILDESSMIGKGIFEDLMSYGIPILAVGDHFQLPPVDTNKGFNLMSDPEIRLEKVHRQAEGNPIIKLSMDIRNFQNISIGVHGNGAAKVRSSHPIVEQFIKKSGTFENTMILCGYNSSRVAINKKIRSDKGFGGLDPQSGERIICLKNNNNSKNIPIFNGLLGTVIYSHDKDTHFVVEYSIDGEQESYFGCVSKDAFNITKPEIKHGLRSKKDLVEYLDFSPSGDPIIELVFPDYFDYGYSLSTHKAQGSQAYRVMVMEERLPTSTEEEWYRWMYTAITRATDQILIVSG